MKKTIANTLHSSRFVTRSSQGRSAMTEIPMDKQSVGVIHLPDVDGKQITEKNLASLKTHEYAHVVLVERDILPMATMQRLKDMGGDDYLVQACMDTAVNAFIGPSCADLPFEHDLTTRKKFVEKFDKLSPVEKVSYYLQALGVYNFGGYKENMTLRRGSLEKKKARLLHDLLLELQKSLRSEYNGQYLSKGVLELVQYCSGTLGKNSKLFNLYNFEQLCRQLIFDAQQSERHNQESQEFAEETEKENLPAPTDAVWGKMDVREAKMEQTMPRTWKQRHVPRYMGSLRYMHRAITDMKVWGLKDRSVPPYAVLIDCSGSMRVDSSQIEQIMVQQPASIVAGYSGNYKSGSVYILGQNGKFATTEEIEAMRAKVGCGNIVDGPAVLWLSQQRNKRLIWITDCNATGAEEVQERGLFAFLEAAVRAYNIEVFKDLESFAAGQESGFRTPWKFR